MISYRDTLDGIRASDLLGFWEGWPCPPDPETHLRVLAGSEAVVLAIDSRSSRVVGFITAVGDGVLAAYIPLLEVLREYRGQGIGGELVRRMLDGLSGRYMVDLVCDEELVPFYEGFGLSPYRAMILRQRDALADLSDADRSHDDG